MARVSADDFSWIPGLAGLALFGYWGLQWHQNSTAVETIERLNPLHSAYIEKELGSRYENVGTRKDQKGRTEDVTHHLKCLRVALEHKVTGHKDTGYFIVDVNDKKAVRISEADAAVCIQK